MTSPKDDSAAYERGRVAGEIQERLASHDQHFAAINGSLGKIDGRLSDMVSALQGVQNQTTAGVEQQRAVAQALREQAAKAWAPWMKVLALIGGLAGLAAVVSLLLLIVRPS